MEFVSLFYLSCCVCRAISYLNPTHNHTLAQITANGYLYLSVFVCEMFAVCSRIINKTHIFRIGRLKRIATMQRTPCGRLAMIRLRNTTVPPNRVASPWLRTRHSHVYACMQRINCVIARDVLRTRMRGRERALKHTHDRALRLKQPVLTGSNIQ